MTAVVAREAARPAEPPAQGRSSARARRRGALGAAAIAVLGGIGLVQWISDGQAGGPGVLPPLTSADAAETVISYTIVYETRYPGADPLREQLDVQRPFRSSFRSGASTRSTERGVLATTSDGDRWLRIEVPVAAPGGDLRPLLVLERAVAEGHLEALGSRTVGGRTCDAYRFGGPVSGGTLTPVGAVEEESAEACIDALGLVLEETWWIDGQVARTRQATEVRVGVQASKPLVVPTGATDLPFEEGGGAIEPLDADHDPGFVEYWRARTIPDGFAHDGRFVVVPPDLDRPPTSSKRGPSDIALITDVWTRGPDLLVIDQGGGRIGAGPPWDVDSPGFDVDLGVLGDGSLVLDLRMSEVRVVRPDDGFVRVAGTLPPEELLAVARSLVPIRTTGGQP